MTNKAERKINLRLRGLFGEPRSELKEALEREVLQTLGPVLLGLALAFVSIAAFNSLDVLSVSVKIALVGLNLATSACFLVLYGSWRKEEIGPQRAHATALAIVVLCLANILLSLALVREPFYLAFLPILLVGCAFVFRSIRWLLAAVGLASFSVAIASWLFVPLELQDYFHHAFIFTVASTLTVILFAAGRAKSVAMESAWQSVRREVERRKEVESSLQAHERRLELAISGSRGAWWDIEMDPNEPFDLPETVTVQSDPALKRLMGFDLEETPSSIEDWGSRIVPEDRERHAAARWAHLTGEVPVYEVEYRVRGADGDLRWIFTRGQVHRDSEGRPLHFSGIDWDITDSKRNEDKLRLLTRAVEQSPSIVIITDTDGTIEYVNARFTKSTGYSAEEVVGENPRLLKSDETAPGTYRELWQTLTEGREWQGELCNRRKDGSHYWVKSTIAPIKGFVGSTQHYLAMQEDVSDQKKVEAELARTQNLESLGQLVSGVAHDFNNLLTSVIGFAELGLAQTGEDAPLYTELSEIKKCGEMAADLTAKLLAFSRQQVLTPKVLDLNEVVLGMRKILRRTIREDRDLQFVLGAELKSVKVDSSQIGQILLNLVGNAHDATKPGDRVTIETADVEFDGQRLFGTAAPAAGSYVMLAVTDTGCGMDEETQARVFEPFFTTKKRDRGTGLGLAAVYGAVKQSGGFISLHSEVGVGSCFKVYFPATVESREPKQVESPVQSLGGQETILVVEDNQSVLKVTTRTLASRGYRVFGCSDAESALPIFLKEDVDLLLTDIVMPGLNGVDLAKQLLAERSDLKVVLMSGYTELAVHGSDTLDGKSLFLHKPFRLADLLGRVRECLDCAG